MAAFPPVWNKIHICCHYHPVCKGVCLFISLNITYEQRETRRTCSVYVRACMATDLQARDGGGIRSKGRGAKVPPQQRVEWSAAGGVCSLPVRLQILGQVLTRILQLILIQNDVKHLLWLKDCVKNISLLVKKLTVEYPLKSISLLYNQKTRTGTSGTWGSSSFPTNLGDN